MGYIYTFILRTKWFTVKGLHSPTHTHTLTQTHFYVLMMAELPFKALTCTSGADLCFQYEHLAVFSAGKKKAAVAVWAAVGFLLTLPGLNPD